MRRYLPAIDVLRFAAAILVMVFHLGFTAWSGAGSSVTGLVAGRYALPELPPVWWGWVGVNIFFVISGLVIAGSADGASAARFAMGRIERLFPAVWICAPITLAVILGTGFMVTTDALARFAKSISLSPSGPWIDGQYWTLRNEIGFYVTIFLLIGAGRFRHIAVFTKTIIVAGIAVVTADALSRNAILPPGVHTLFAMGSFQFLPLYYGCFFGLGLCIWLRHQGLAMSPIYLWIATLGCLIEIIVKAYWQVGSSSHLTAWRSFGFLLPAVLWLSAIAICFRAAPSRDPHGRRAAVARSLGLATYPLYLLHFTVGAWLIAIFTEAGMWAPVAFLIVCAGLIGASVAISRYGEPGVRRVLHAVMSAIVDRLQLSTARRPLLADAGRASDIRLPAQG